MSSLTGKQIEQALVNSTLKHRARFTEIFPKQDVDRFRPSAVVMPLIRSENEWHLLFTHRSSRLNEHSGQVSFPGGAREMGDKSLEGTALREMEEEIGVKPRDVVIFGSLGEMPVITGYLVRVFVGQIPWPYDLKINQDEVESVFTIPLQWLADPDHSTSRCRSYDGQDFSVIFYDFFEGHQLWGASAEMTTALLERLKITG